MHVVLSWDSIGVALSFVLGPQLMPSYDDDNNPSSTEVANIRTSIQRYMWYQCAFVGAVFLAILIYFPNRPPHAPSRSAETSRVSFATGLLALLKHKQFWLVATAYGVMTGVYSGWSAYLEPNLQSFLSADRAQNESGWIGFYGTLAGCVGGVGLGYLTDRLGGKMKVSCFMHSFAAVSGAILSSPT
jgi:FLVCR family MFS transporter